MKKILITSAIMYSAVCFSQQPKRDTVVVIQREIAEAPVKKTTFLEILQGVGAFMLILTPLILAAMKRGQDKMITTQKEMAVKQDIIKEQTDGKIALLLEVTGAKEHALGKEAGKAEQKQETKQDLKDANEQNKESKSNVQEVNIVAQTEPVKVKIEDQTKPVDVKVTKQGDKK